MKKLLLTILVFLPAAGFGQTKIDSPVYVYHLPDTVKAFFWSMDSINAYSQISLNYYDKSDTIQPYNVVGVYRDGELRMFEAKYLIYKPYSFSWKIIGMSEGDSKNLIGIYSYQDEDGYHTVSMSVCHKWKKGEKRVNWSDNAGCCCK